MNRILEPTCDHSIRETIKDQELLNRQFLFTIDPEDGHKRLYIKWNNQLFPIGGDLKQNYLEAGDNIEIIRETDEFGEDIIPELIRLLDDIDINTCTLSPDGDNTYNWKGTIPLGELHNNNSILLLTKATNVEADEKSLIGGEILVKGTLDDGSIRYGHYAITLTSTGSWSLKGAMEAETGVRMCRCEWKGDFYYGIKLPKAWQTELTDVSYRRTITLRRTGGNTWQIRNSAGNYVALNTTSYTSGYNSWYYCSLDDVMNLAGVNGNFVDDSLAPYYGKGYYLYLYMYRRTNNANNDVRVTQVAIAQSILGATPSASNTIGWYGVTEPDWMDFNESFIRNDTYYALANNSSVTLLSFLESGQQVNTELVDFKDVEVWFNGWLHVDDPPRNFYDPEISYTILSDKSDDNDYFAETFYMEAANVANKITELQNTGEDNAPYRFIISGTINMSQLRAIANVCKDPEKQIWLDMGQATVATDARNWSNVFNDCVSLRGLTVPRNVTHIGNGTFQWCTYLRYLDLTPSQGTLTRMGGGDGWAQGQSLVTSTRIRNLIIPSSVNTLEPYLLGASNVTNLIFLHQNNNTISVDQRTFMITTSTNSGNDIVDLPANFHCYMTYSWRNGYIQSNYINNAGMNYQWGGNTGWWVGEVTRNIVLYEPSWSQEQWQAFYDNNYEYGWDEDLINRVRSYFGYTNAIEIKEKFVA